MCKNWALGSESVRVDDDDGILVAELLRAQAQETLDELGNELVSRGLQDGRLEHGHDMAQASPRYTEPFKRISIRIFQDIIECSRSYIFHDFDRSWNGNFDWYVNSLLHMHWIRPENLLINETILLARSFKCSPIDRDMNWHFDMFDDFDRVGLFDFHRVGRWNMTETREN